MPDSAPADALATYIRRVTNDGLDVLDVFIKIFHGESVGSTTPSRVMAADQIVNLAFRASQQGLGRPTSAFELALLRSHDLFQSAVRFLVEVVEGNPEGTDTRVRILVAHHLRDQLRVIDRLFYPDRFVVIFREETRNGQLIEEFLNSIVDDSHDNVSPDDFFNALQLIEYENDHNR